MRAFLFSISAVLLLLVPSASVAAPPAGVTGLAAIKESETRVKLYWDPVPSDISYYRIYYSAQSILENDGFYDDFERTRGPETAFTLDLPAGMEKAFLAVLAVNSLGEESAFFVEEISVSLKGVVSSSSAALPIKPLLLLSAEYKDPTSFVLHFTENLKPLEQRVLTGAITLKDNQGTPTKIEEATISGSTILARVLPLQMNKVYEVTVSSAVEGLEGERMQADGNTTLFIAREPSADRGRAERSSSSSSQVSVGASLSVSSPGLPPPVTQISQSSASGRPGEIANLTLTAAEDERGTYTVTGQWDFLGDGIVKEYLVRQTFDGGVTYGPPESLQPEVKGARVTDVPAGEFGIAVAAVATDGRMTTGKLESITLAATGTVPRYEERSSSSRSSRATQNPVQGSLTGRPQGKPLTQTGVGALSVVAISAAGAALWRKKFGRK